MSPALLNGILDHDGAKGLSAQLETHRGSERLRTGRWGDSPPEFLSHVRQNCAPEFPIPEFTVRTGLFSL